MLEDPKNVFGFQNVTPIVSTSVLEAEGPAFEDTLNAVSRALTTEAMQQMNAAVAIDKKTPADVAQRVPAGERPRVADPAARRAGSPG